MAFRTDHRREGRIRARYAQNLFRDRGEVGRLVERADLQPGDTVYDLGAGTGMITRELVRRGARVVAVERDPNLVRKLQDRFANQPVVVLAQDLGEVRFRPPFRIVANIPFNRTAQTLKRLLLEPPAPEEALLVLQREAARKFAGIPHEYEVSVSAKPWFDLTIEWTFPPTAFVPAPSVGVVLLHIRRRAQPLLPEVERRRWLRFIGYSFGRTKPTLRAALKPVFSALEWRRLSADLGFHPDATITSITLKQWLGLFRFFSEGLTPERQARVAG